MKKIVKAPYKVVKLGGLILIFSLLTGCFGGFFGKQNKLTPEEKILLELKQKYNEEFVIDDLEEKNIGQNFAVYIYEASVYKEGNEEDTFKVRLQEEQLLDNYAKILYQEYMESYVEELLVAANVSIQEVGIEFLLNTEPWKDASDYKEKVCIYLVMSIQEESSPTEVRNVYNFIKQLEENGYYYRVRLHVGNKEKYLTYNENMPALTEEELIAKIAR